MIRRDPSSTAINALVVGAASLALAACSAGGNPMGGDSGGDVADVSSSHDASTDVASSDTRADAPSTHDTGVSHDSGTTSDSGTPLDCASGTELVYLVTGQNTLYSFDPGTLTFTRIGTLGCSAGSANPYSMSVDRNGTAWVLYGNGHLFRVSILDASCQSTTYVPNQGGHLLFGMGFSSDGAGSSSETLYVGTRGPNVLGRIDLTSLTFTEIGAFSSPFNNLFNSPEMTGTGDGRLYGFFVTSPTQVGQIDKSSGGVAMPHTITGNHAGNGWAFAFWGGEFWIFTAANNPSSSDLTRYNPSTGAIDVVRTNLGFLVVGAGVSTCAPLVPPG